jgi:hypothetical protein
MITDVCGGEGERPDTYEQTGADPAVFEAIRARRTGAYYTLGYLGGATALLAPWEALELVEGSEDRRHVLGRFFDKYGWLEPEVLLCCVRNDFAPVIHNCAEPAGGMATTCDLLLEQTKEIVEIGLYQPTMGWIPYDATSLDELGRFALIGEQQKCWEIAEPSFPMSPDPIELQHLRIGSDSFDDRRGVISAGPVGDFAITSFARLDLPRSGGYRIRDLECHFDRVRKIWVPLNRKVVAIAHRPSDSPLMFEFGSDGLLDRCGMHMALEGAALELNISHLCRAVLGRHGLNWLKE